MKKNKRSARREVKIIAAKNTHIPNTDQKVAHQSAPLLPRPRRLWLDVKLVSGIVVTVLGLLAAIVGILGPPWPTEPSFSPGFPSAGSPFDIPFTVTNKSALFRISNLTLVCKISFARTLLGDTFENISVNSTGINTLQPGQTSSYTCLFNRIMHLNRPPPFETKFAQAEISFASEYDSPWLFPRRIKVASDPFTLNSSTDPPQWTQGIPLQ
ncbi:MAG: hypothetical protein M3Z96_07835 [Pseudomonadota bacterium]|nr:hypothetical protein [Pseudomonadota bacterium]